MNTEEICQAIAKLCNENEEQNWAALFHSIANELENEEISSVRRDILGLFGGAGSFNDLVLHRNGHPLGVENNELDSLRTELYNGILEQ